MCNDSIKILSFVFLIFIACSSPQTEAEKIEQIIKVQEPSISNNVSQLLLVISEEPGNAQTKLFALEKEDGIWKQKTGPVAAGIGKNGFAAFGEKVEDDGKSPSGVFRLGHLFTYADTVITRMPYSISTAEDKWIDDQESDDYNKHVRGDTDAKSFEKLKLKSSYYKYCMVIEYNTDPVVKGKGSAIFFHLRESDTENTSGCVGIAEKDMQQILEWLDPTAHPMIVMGDSQTLLHQSFL